MYNCIFYSPGSFTDDDNTVVLHSIYDLCNLTNSCFVNSFADSNNIIMNHKCGHVMGLKI